jgi:hypothetical protein
MAVARRPATAGKRSPERAKSSSGRTTAQRRTALRRHLTAVLNELGYTTPAPDAVGRFKPEVRRRNPYRGSLVYGATLLPADLENPEQHERLVFFANRRTKKRASIQLYIAVEAGERERVEALLDRLGIRTQAQGGNVQLTVVDDS